MNSGQKGFTLIEMLISISIMVAASGAAGAAIFQIMRNTERNSDYMNIVRQVENAGYWINHDVQISQSLTSGNLTFPDFLVTNWTVWDDEGNPTFHSARYYFEGLSNGIATLKRNHISTGGASESTLIANYIYYNVSDIAHSTNISYQSPVLTVKLTASLGQSMETKQYNIKRRPNF